MILLTILPTFLGSEIYANPFEIIYESEVPYDGEHATTVIMQRNGDGDPYRLSRVRDGRLLGEVVYRKRTVINCSRIVSGQRRRSPQVFYGKEVSSGITNPKIVETVREDLVELIKEYGEKPYEGPSIAVLKIQLDNIVRREKLVTLLRQWGHPIPEVKSVRKLELEHARIVDLRIQLTQDINSYGDFADTSVTTKELACHADWLKITKSFIVQLCPNGSLQTPIHEIQQLYFEQIERLKEGAMGSLCILAEYSASSLLKLLKSVRKGLYSFTGTPCFRTASVFESFVNNNYDELMDDVYYDLYKEYAVQLLDRFWEVIVDPELNVPNLAYADRLRHHSQLLKDVSVLLYIVKDRSLENGFANTSE